MKLSISKLSEENLESAFVLHRENMKDYVDRHIEGGWVETMARKWLSDSFEKDLVYGIYVEEDFIGFIMLEFKENSLYIENIQLKSQFQGKGLSAQIFSFIENLAKEHKYTFLELTVFWDNPSVNLYKRIGFEVVSEKEHIHSHVMKKKL